WRVFRRIPPADEESWALVLGSIGGVPPFPAPRAFEENFGHTGVVVGVQGDSTGGRRVVRAGARLDGGDRRVPRRRALRVQLRRYRGAAGGAGGDGATVRRRARPRGRH